MKYTKLGAKLAQARLEAGIGGQVDLARKLGVGQQTVSRWEKGTSRPEREMLEHIGRLLRIGNIEELREFAGYGKLKASTELTVETRTVAFDQPFPLMALSAESFERFSAMLLEMLYEGRSAEVNRRGGAGHAQNGIDIELRFPNGETHLFQCKRHSSFGPHKLKEAVRLLTADSEAKVILLASVASPQARDEIKKHAGWQIWDCDDITRQIRSCLVLADQIKLVDTFFFGQRHALLGEIEASPWIEPSGYFKNMDRLDAGFNHGWKLQGRAQELKQVDAFLKCDEKPVLLLIGNGGGGKTRFLKAICDRLEIKKQNRKIYLLSRERLTTTALEKLGCTKLLLICDDAHDREDLGLLFDYVSANSDNVKLIVSTRGYGVNRIKQQVRTLLVSEFEEISLKKMGLAESVSLAREALAFLNADTSRAEQLARFTLECPLATIVGAKVLASKPNESVVLTNETAFRAELLNKFAKELVGEISEGLNPKEVRQVLSAIALMQPIFDGDNQLLSAIAQMFNLDVPSVARICQRLRDASILFSRGPKSRIAPDLLGEFLLGDSCVAANSQSTGFAELVFENAPTGYVENIIVNLGRLDWLMSEGDTTKSHLLEGIWSKLRWEHEYHSPHVAAAAAAAYFQPKQALSFATSLIDDSKINDDVVKIIENVAFHIEHLPEAAQLLWKLGATDARAQNRHPHHGIRVLEELATPMPGKPAEYINVLIDFVESLVPVEKNWETANTPLTILAGVLKSAGHTTSSSRTAIHLHPYLVSIEQMKPLRERAVQICLTLLGSEDPRKGYAAAATLGGALRFPTPIGGLAVSDELHKNWCSEFVETLEKIDVLLERTQVPSVVFIKLVEAVSWHAFFYDGPTSAVAKKIVARLDSADTHVQLVRCLVDGWGHRTRPRAGDAFERSRIGMMKEAATFVFKQYPSAQQQISVLEQCLSEIAEVEQESPGSAYMFINFLFQEKPELALRVAQHSISNPKAKLSEFLGAALSVLLNHDHHLAEPLVQSLLDSKQAELLVAVAEAYTRYTPKASLTETDVNALNAITMSDDWRALSLGATAAYQLSQFDQALGISLLVSANFAASEKAAHDYLMWLCSIVDEKLGAISDGQFDVLLEKIGLLESLDDHWTQEFLRKGMQRNPKRVVLMLLGRIERAGNEDGRWKRPISSGPYQQMSLGLSTHHEAHQILLDVLNWALQKAEEDVTTYHLGSLADSLFAPFDEMLLSRVEAWMQSGSVAHVNVVLAFVREAGPELVTKFEHFVADLLQRAASLSSELHSKATSVLYSTAISGLRSGTPGQPFAEDLRLRDLAKARIEPLGVFNPAYRLYKGLLQHAERAIARQHAEGYAMLAEDDCEI